MKEILNQLFEHKKLSYEQSVTMIKNIAEGKYNECEIASFLTVFMMRAITVDELRGFRDALLELCIPVDLSEFDPIDVCGTGGDSKNTFNISTLSTFVLAGAGIKVAKHGNYAVSSGSGASNIMESIGYKFSSDEGKLKSDIEKYNICYMHAQNFHPAMKNVGPVRKQLAVKTFFNMLGPMVNPAKIRNQLVGVYNKEVVRLYNYLYQQSNISYAIIHSLDGYDEVSLTGKAKIITNKGEKVLEPESFGFSLQKPEDIHGGDNLEDALKIFNNVLEGNATEQQNNVVLANSALAINVIYPEKELLECVEIAKDSLFGKKALNTVKKLVEN